VSSLRIPSKRRVVSSIHMGSGTARSVLGGEEEQGMMQDMIKAYLVAIAGAAGISTWKLIQRYWRILTTLSISVASVMLISLISLEAPMIPSSGVRDPGIASANLSGSITMAFAGDTFRCSAGSSSWSPQRVELKSDTVSLLCIDP
jgi:hypothetical protein